MLSASCHLIDGMHAPWQYCTVPAAAHRRCGGHDDKGLTLTMNTSLPCPSLIAQLAPHSHRACHRSRPLVIMAGDGKTGTTTYAWAAQELGLYTAHWIEMLCPHPSNRGECSRRKDSWMSFRRRVSGLQPDAYATFDFCTALKDMDAIADVPIPQIMPFIFAAHADARVVLTVRDPVEWYPRRVQWKPGGTDMAPLLWLTGLSLTGSRGGAGAVGTVGRTMNVVGLEAAAWSYFAELALAVCLVPPAQLLLTDFFSHHSGRGEPERWQRFAQLLDVPLPRWADTRPFRGPSAMCIVPPTNGYTGDGCGAFWRDYRQFWTTHDRSDHGSRRPALPVVTAAGATRLRYLAPASASDAAPCHRARPLVILAGQAHTGAASYAWAAQQLGLVTGSWQAVLCPHDMSEAECHRRERAWTSFRTAVWQLKQREYAAFDFCSTLRDLDAIADVPVPQLLPFIMAAHPDARVVLTVKDSVEWYRQHAQWQHGVHAAPLYWLMGRSLSQIYPEDAFEGAVLRGTWIESHAGQPKVASTAWAASKLGSAAGWSYFVELALAVCIVPPARESREEARKRTHRPDRLLCILLSVHDPRAGSLYTCVRVPSLAQNWCSTTSPPPPSRQTRHDGRRSHGYLPCRYHHGASSVPSACRRPHHQKGHQRPCPSRRPLQCRCLPPHQLQLHPHRQQCLPRILCPDDCLNLSSPRCHRRQRPRQIGRRLFHRQRSRCHLSNHLATISGAMVMHHVTATTLDMPPMPSGHRWRCHRRHQHQIRARRARRLS